MGLVGKNAVQDALDKWDGIVRKPGSQIEEKVPGCDRVFLDEFSAASVRAETLAKFSVPNYNARLTGGYSIVRTFRGGISEWAPRLDAFAKGKVAKERAEYKRNARRSIAINIFQDLANMEGTSRNGNKGNIGTVTASKLAF